MQRGARSLLSAVSIGGARGGPRFYNTRDASGVFAVLAPPRHLMGHALALAGLMAFSASHVSAHEEYDEPSDRSSLSVIQGDLNDEELDDQDDLEEEDFMILKTDREVADVLASNRDSPTPVRPAIYKIVLTGGPCGGKSTAVSLLSKRLDSLGFKIFVVPEAATILFTGGGRPDSSYHSGELEREIVFETQKIKTQIALEGVFYRLAQATNRPTVIICDRGTMDSAAYVGTDMFNIMMRENDWTVASMRDNRYDAVLHLVTAALGAEDYYSSASNKTRSEDFSMAQALDLSILQAWVGHPNLSIVDNSTDFKGKMDRVVTVICRSLGVPRPKSIERKFLVKGFTIPPEIHTSKHYTETTFLLRDDANTQGYIFVTKRGDTPGSSHSYFYSAKHVFADGESAIMERQISGMEYNTLLSQVDTSRAVVRKKIRSFLWNNHYWQLISFVQPHAGLAVLKTEAEHTDQHIDMPPFVKTLKEVTDDSRFSTYSLAGEDVMQWMFSVTKGKH